MYPRTWHRPRVVRIEQQDRLRNVRVGDRLLGEASALIKQPAKSAGEFAARLNRACKTLLNSQGHFMEAGMRGMADFAGQCRLGLREIESEVREIERQGGR